mmetsp:Transcript_24366/g.27024  ORF Transcript_24366/g.27024 Transcript_24366/m.27024 type:complete len:184 (-) Transcript_24366:46-597(-)|eukprot:CAMPEP_0205830130 /NCGR_PEP_ID=MMETSP0206-20130828/40143_1 /ASSEMBLY_ACC=CAM_ASM_000279 /TAXON_ID=36767 /ORGANISM="Euplotes focardii, Strain TN1" /LENGTH=183 /DNA_ID=CAMNT_0053133479 /DNA_START=112 /DNA_END=663 /DNA_ORIENTATION=+
MKVDSMLKSKIDLFRYELNRLKEAAFQMNNDPYKYGINPKEADKRRIKVEQYEEKLQIMEAQITLAVGGSGIGTINDSNSLGMGASDLEENLIGEDGEYNNTRGNDNRQVLDTQKKMLKGQDKHLDQISIIAGEIKQEAIMGGEEMDYQNDMLDDLNKGLDKTNIKMMRVDNKLKHLIAESNQ